MKLYVIKIRDLPLYLHKTSNMFTTDIQQSRSYVKKESAEKWIENIRQCSGDDKRWTEYKNRFVGLEFIVIPVTSIALKRIDVLH